MVDTMIHITEEETRLIEALVCLERDPDVLEIVIRLKRAIKTISIDHYIYIGFAIGQNLAARSMQDKTIQIYKSCQKLN